MNSESLSSLSDRELEIARLCKEGFISKEIADQLGLSVRTVENHKFKIFRKLGLRNVLELVRFMCENDKE